MRVKDLNSVCTNKTIIGIDNLYNHQKIQYIKIDQWVEGIVEEYDLYKVNKT